MYSENKLKISEICLLIHEPSEGKDIDVKENFYNKLYQAYKSIPRDNLKIIIGDTNANIVT